MTVTAVAPRRTSKRVRTRKISNLSSGRNNLEQADSVLTLRVVWPVLDDSLFDREAMTEAAKLWPGFVELHGVKLAGAPHMRVAELDDHQRQAFGANRAVVCMARVERRPPQAGDGQ